MDVEGDGSTHGWEVSAYDLLKDSDDDEGYWDHVSQDRAETPPRRYGSCVEAIA